MSPPNFFYDSSLGDWRLFFPSFEAYDAYERERLAYRDSVEMAENRPQCTGFHQPLQAEHMGYAGLPLPFLESTFGLPPTQQQSTLDPRLAQQQSTTENNLGDQTQCFSHRNPLNLNNYPPPHRNQPQTTFEPQSAYEQVFRNVSAYPDVEQPSAPSDIEQGTRRRTERQSGPPLSVINATLSGTFKHSRKPKPPQMKTEANAKAAASDKKRHDYIIANGVAQDDPCGQCRVKQRLTPAHKCYKIETVNEKGEVEKGRCHYCTVRRQKCAVESAETTQNRMYGRRQGKEVETEDEATKAAQVKKEKKTEAKKLEAHSTGDARAYNAAFRAQDEQDVLWDVTQRLQQPCHGSGMLDEDAQREPHTQEYIRQIRSFSVHAHPARSLTPIDHVTYPPGHPQQPQYAPHFPMPGYVESLCDNVVGAMNQGRRHRGQALPLPVFRSQPAVQYPYHDHDHNPRNVYGQRSLPPPLAPAQHNPLNLTAPGHDGWNGHIAPNPLNPFAPGYLGRYTHNNPHNQRSGQYTDDNSPYNQRIAYTPAPNPYGRHPPPSMGASHNTFSPYNSSFNEGSEPFANRQLPAPVPPSPSAERLGRMNAPAPHRPAQPSTPSQSDTSNNNIQRPLSFLPSDTPESVARRAAQGRGLREAGARAQPSQLLPSGQSSEGRRAPRPVQRKKSAVRNENAKVVKSKNTKKSERKEKK